MTDAEKAAHAREVLAELSTAASRCMLKDAWLELDALIQQHMPPLPTPPRTVTVDGVVWTEDRDDGNITKAWSNGKGQWVPAKWPIRCWELEQRVKEVEEKNATLREELETDPNQRETLVDLNVSRSATTEAAPTPPAAEPRRWLAVVDEDGIAHDVSQPDEIKGCERDRARISCELGEECTVVPVVEAAAYEAVKQQLAEHKSKLRDVQDMSGKYFALKARIAVTEENVKRIVPLLRGPRYTEYASVYSVLRALNEGEG